MLVDFNYGSEKFEWETIIQYCRYTYLMLYSCVAKKRFLFDRESTAGLLTSQIRLFDSSLWVGVLDGHDIVRFLLYVEFNISNSVLFESLCRRPRLFQTLPIIITTVQWTRWGVLAFRVLCSWKSPRLTMNNFTTLMTEKVNEFYQWSLSVSGE